MFRFERSYMYLRARTILSQTTWSCIWIRFLAYVSSWRGFTLHPHCSKFSFPYLTKCRLVPLLEMLEYASAQWQGKHKLWTLQNSGFSVSSSPDKFFMPSEKKKKKKKWKIWKKIWTEAVLIWKFAYVTGLKASFRVKPFDCSAHKSASCVISLYNRAIFR